MLPCSVRRVVGGMAVAGGHCMPKGAKCFPKSVDNAGSVKFDHEMRGRGGGERLTKALLVGSDCCRRPGNWH